jgi:hypothetical protein
LEDALELALGLTLRFSTHNNKGGAEEVPEKILACEFLG